MISVLYLVFCNMFKKTTILNVNAVPAMKWLQKRRRRAINEGSLPEFNSWIMEANITAILRSTAAYHEKCGRNLCCDFGEILRAAHFVAAV